MVSCHFLQNTAISNQMKLDMIYTFAELFWHVSFRITAKAILPVEKIFLLLRQVSVAIEISCYLTAFWSYLRTFMESLFLLQKMKTRSPWYGSSLNCMLTDATKPGICLRKSVAPHARKIRLAPSAIRFIIIFSSPAEVLKGYPAGNHQECIISFPENKSWGGYHLQQLGYSDYRICRMKKKPPQM